MKKFALRILSFFLATSLLFCIAPQAACYEWGEPWAVDLSDFLDNLRNRRYVEMMLDHYLRENTMVQKTLADGCPAMFLFEGCSDNIDDLSLADLHYFRVTAVCVVLMLDENGEPYIIYFNESCSTIPDRPLEYGAWYFPEVGDVGPATICDGTYELYSVKHMGDYEALHMRDSYDDDKLDAVYMTPEGYHKTEADCINIHTRTSNHTSGRGMWSAGCMLVGDGNYGQFLEMMDCTYYMVHDFFEVDQFVGCVTINRQYLKEALYDLYESRDAVDMFLAESRQLLPETYLRQCKTEATYDVARQMQTASEVQLMTLPCSNVTDARSLSLGTLLEGETLDITAQIRNTEGQLWYETGHYGRKCYILVESMEEIPQGNWFTRFWKKLFG